MNVLEWLKDGHADEPRPVYVVHGDDPYLIRESLAVIIGLFFPEDDHTGVERFVGSEAKLAAVLDMLHTLPFFGGKRLAVVEEADPFVSRHRSELESYVEKPSSSGVLVLITRNWPSTTRLAKLVESRGRTIHATCPREKELAGWLTQLAKKAGARIDKDAASHLIELVGPAPGQLATEIDKLAVYAGEEKHIRTADVSLLVGAGRIETVWKILEKALEGNAREALILMDGVLSSGEPPIALLAAMTANLMKLHHAGLLRTRRIGLAEACQAAGIPAFAVDRTRKQHAHLGPCRTSELPKALLQVDLDLKGGSALTPRAVLEILISRLAAPRLD